MSRRLLLECMDFRKNPTSFGDASPKDEDLMDWRIVINGPSNSPYDGGLFRVRVKFSAEYPFKPPSIKFLTKIYHPNVSTSGEICKELLTENWKPHLNIRYIMEVLRTLLICPNPLAPVEANIGAQYRENRAEFDAMAQKWTKNHATN